MAELSKPVCSPRQQVYAWAMYDWANSAYSTLSITVLELYLIAALPDKVGQLVWGWGLGLTMFVTAVLSPVVGAMADARANKRIWLLWTTALGAGASALMFFGTREHPWLLVGCFLTANLGMELSQGFYNAFLTEIADDETMGRVSALGYGLGYLGGGLALLLAILMIKHPEYLGLPSGGDLTVRLALLFMGAWWGVFSLPILVCVRDKTKPRSEPLAFAAAARRALSEVKRTIGNIRAYRMLALFLLGFLIFNDGVQTVINQASGFAQDVLKMRQDEIMSVFLMIQFVALPGAIFVGRLADRIGQKQTLMACLVVWIAVLIASFFVNDRLHFWVLSAVVALVLGGTQSVSRTIMGLMTPARHSAEFFGFFNLSSKAASILGPPLFATLLTVTGSAHVALSSLLIFFLLGSLIIAPLDVERGMREARAEVAG